MKIGIDLGGTNLVAALCKENGEIVSKLSVPTKVGDPEGVKADMKMLAKKVCDNRGSSYKHVTSIGLGVPGSFIKETCTFEFATNLQMRNVCFAEAFKPEFDVPVYIDNDGNCAALGEALRGAGTGARNVVMVTLGTGVGGGLVIDGKLYTGSNNIAGEIGHMVIVAGGDQCNCGRRGCMERYCSATAMIRMANEAMDGSADESSLRAVREQSGKITAKDVCDARDAGDALAERVFDKYCDYLACGLANLINILQPDCIVLGGGVSGYGEKLAAPVREKVGAEQFKVGDKMTPVHIATLGNDAGLIGAAMLKR